MAESLTERYDERIVGVLPCCDRLVITGTLPGVCYADGMRSGDAAAMDELGAIAAATALPVIVGAGVTSTDVGEILTVADGVIVASTLKRDGVW